jgi:sec-independent protein translocase protein TatB
MFNLDPGKLLVIGVVAIILLGPDKLPQVARQVGGAWRSFNEFRHRMETEVRGSIPDLPSTNEIARLARSPSALLNHLSNMGTDDPKSPGGIPSNGSSGAAAAQGGAAAGSGGRPSSTPARPVSQPAPASPPDGVVSGDPSLN